MKLQKYLEKVYNEAPIDLVPTKVDKKATELTLNVRHGNSTVEIVVDPKNIDMQKSDQNTWVISNPDAFLNDVRNRLIGKGLLGNETQISKQLKAIINQKKQILRNKLELETGKGKDGKMKLGINKDFNDGKADTFE